MLAIAFWQAYEARGIQSEFAEANYISLSVFSLTQGFLTGIPIVAVVKDIPEAFFLILTFLIFVVCMVVLCLIFVPKIYMQRHYATMTLKEQKKAMAVSVRKSARMSDSSASSVFRAAAADSSAHSSSRSQHATARVPALPKIDEKQAIVVDSSIVTSAKGAGSSELAANARGELLKSPGGSGAFVAKIDGRRLHSSYLDDDDLAEDEDDNDQDEKKKIESSRETKTSVEDDETVDA